MTLTVTRGAHAEYQDEKGGKYFSCSQVLKALDPNAFTNVDPFILAAAGMRGEKLHLLLALTLMAHAGACEMPLRPTGIVGRYYEGIEKFCQDRNPQAIQVEQSSVNRKMGYAGTPDAECIIDGVDCLIDLKTGPPRATHAAQLHGYKRMEGYAKVKKLYSLYITKDGRYKFIEHTTEIVAWSWFQAGLSVLRGRMHYGVL